MLQRHRFLRTREVRLVLRDLHKRKKRSSGVWTNLIIFRLATGCGLRCREICGLRIKDLVLKGAAPTLRVRKEYGKGKKARRVSLDWDRGTLEDIREWVKFRVEVQGAQPSDRVVVVQRCGKLTPLRENKVASRWKTAIKCLGPERVSQLSIHTGRHTFSSHATARGWTSGDVRDALGHASISTTNRYVHGQVDTPEMPDLYPMEDE